MDSSDGLIEYVGEEEQDDLQDDMDTENRFYEVLPEEEYLEEYMEDFDGEEEMLEGRNNLR